MPDTSTNENRVISFKELPVSCINTMVTRNEKGMPMVVAMALMGASLGLVFPSYMALMLGVRFLTDHIGGDVYFRVLEPGDNLRRADEQFKLLREFASNAGAIESIAEKW